MIKFKFSIKINNSYLRQKLASATTKKGPDATLLGLWEQRVKRDMDLVAKRTTRGKADEFKWTKDALYWLTNSTLRDSAIQLLHSDPSAEGWWLKA